MATSPIYNWPEPDNTDLVKNGALAIRTLGDAIDTTMATMVPKTIVDAKGDLIAGTAADTAARLAVGNNGETLVADSSTATGLRYTAGNPITNPVLNSCFDIWQRGTTFTGGGSQNYTADRWIGWRSGTTFARFATSDTTNLPNIQYCMRVQRNNGDSSTSAIFLSQALETVNSIPFAGKTIIVSFYARKGALYSPTSSLLRAICTTGTGTDQNPLGGFTGAVDTVSDVTLTTTWQRFSFSVAVSATATQIATSFQMSPSGTAGANDYYEITGVQIDVGSVALPFRTNAGTIQGELAACQRYYYRETGAEAGVITTGFGQAYSTTNTYAIFKPKVTMRVTPTAVDYSNLRVENGISAVNVTSTSLWGASTSNAPAILNTTGGTFTTTTSWYIAFSAAGYIGFSAEL